jgi:hypothetical protein
VKLVLNRKVLKSYVGKPFLQLFPRESGALTFFNSKFIIVFFLSTNYAYTDTFKVACVYSIRYLKSLHKVEVIRCGGPFGQAL